MIEWSSIPIIYRAYSYFNKYFDLSQKQNALIAKEVQLNNWEQELLYLRKISVENSQNYESMIYFRPSRGSIKAENNNPSPYLEFSYSISNFSIFNFKIQKISMHAFYDNYELLPQIEITENMEVTPKNNCNGYVKHPLQPRFIEILKLLKKEGKDNQIEIILRDVIIDFSGDKEFRKSWGPPLIEESTEFKLKIPIEDIHIS